MDREFVLSVLGLLLAGLAAHVAGCWPEDTTDTPGGRERERRDWRRIWLPLAPAALVAAGLAGWAWSEPRDAEAVPLRLILAALPFAVLVGRAGVRAWMSSRASGEVVAGTVGLFRPRVVLSDRLGAALDESARAAVLLHEAAHLRHRDPLRLWIAQIATDLQWPWPSARRRFSRWIESLELARDEEARDMGAAGEDLAAAVLAGARLSGAERLAVASMVPAAGSLETRIGRLLVPVRPDIAPTGWPATLAAFSAAAAVSAALGLAFGETIVQALIAGSR